MATATIEPDVPHVYIGMGEILKHLSVEKSGTLPGNMGGKPYIPAHEIAAEVKRKLVENEMIVLVNEVIEKHETIQANNRITIAMVISGEYTFFSLKDGSKVTVTGTGDGLANGTAVASNIASTNAMKNALLRTFMITEQSVEDQAKNGIDETEAVQPKAVRQAANGTTNAPERAADGNLAKLREDIKAKVAEIKEATGVDVKYGAIGGRLFKDDAKWPQKVSALKKVLAAIEAGETE